MAMSFKPSGSNIRFNSGSPQTNQGPVIRTGYTPTAVNFQNSQQQFSNVQTIRTNNGPSIQTNNRVVEQQNPMRSQKIQIPMFYHGQRNSNRPVEDNQRMSGKTGSLYDTHVNPKLNNLYDPLREALDVTHMQPWSNIKPMSPNDKKKLQSQIIIPLDAHLVPTERYDLIRNKTFQPIIKRQVIGASISQQQIDQIRKRNPQVNEVVYDYGEERIQNAPTKLNSAPPPPKRSAPLKETYAPSTSEPIKPDTTYKYNLFNSIDEPINLCRMEGCGCFGIPSNQIISSQSNPKSIENWSK